MRLQRHLLLCFLAVTVGLLSACGGNSEEDEESENGHVRLVNATSSYSSVDFYEADNLLASSIADGAASGYATLDQSGYTFKMKQAGTTTTLVSSGQNAYKDEWYSLVAYTTGGSLKTTYLSDNETAPGSGTTKLRVYNASTEAGTLDVYVTNTDDITQLTPTISSASAQSITSFQEVASGSYRIRVTGTGDPTDVRLDLPAVSLGSQHVDTLVLTTGKGGVLVDGVLLTQRGSVTAQKNTQARIRLAASTVPTGNNVKVEFAGTAEPLSSTSPGVSAYKLMPAGTLTMTVTIGNSTVLTASDTAAAGDDITLLVTGTSTINKFISDDNKPPLSSANARLRLYNGLNGLSSTLTLTSDGSIVGDNIALGSASSFVTITGDDHELEVTSPGQAASVYGPATRSLLANKVYSLFALGTAVSPTIVLRANR